MAIERALDRVIRNIYVVYSPDEDIYYLEDRNPGKWKVSKEDYKTDESARRAALLDRVTWMNP